MSPSKDGHGEIIASVAYVLEIAAIGQRESTGLAPIECNKVAGKLLVIQSMVVINKNWIYHKFNFIFCDLPSTAKIFQFRSDCDYLCQFVEVDGRVYGSRMQLLIQSFNSA